MDVSIGAVDEAEGAERWALHGHTVAYYPRAGVMSFDPNPLIRSCCSAAVYMIPSRWVWSVRSLPCVL